MTHPQPDGPAPSSLAARLADYALSLDFEHLDADTVAAARQRIVDSLGCALGALDSAPVRSIGAYANTLPEGPASILFSSRKIATEVAAFLNATMIRFLDFNDGYFALEPGHPSDNIAALLAIAQAEGRSGRDVIVAMVIAYEVQMRLQDAATLFRRGWDHVNYVTISSTLAAGRLLGLSRTEMVHALGMALNGHIAMRQVRSGALSAWKGASAANATRNAVFCASLARHAMTGPSEIFEGEMGFFAQVTGPFDLDPGRFGRAGRPDFQIKNAKTKLYPTNGEMQTAVMAALALRKRIDSVDAIESIRIDTTDVGFKFLAKDKAKWRPQTRETADHSLPYTVARALLDGTITRATYDEADFSEPRMLALIDRISVHEDPVLAAQMPSLANRVTLLLKNGESMTMELGTKENPRTRIADDEIESKFRGFATGRLDAGQIDRALKICWTFDRLDDVGELFAAVRLDGR